MSKSYDRNIERLKANQRSVSQQEQNIILQAGQDRASRIRSDTKAITGALAQMSPTLQRMEDNRKKRLEEEGRRLAQEARKTELANMSATAQRLKQIEFAKSTGELAFDFESAEIQELEYQKLKQQLLAAGGAESYYDAERIAQLSPYRQAGYAKEKLRMFQDAYPSMLQNELMNSNEVINLNGIKFTPAELRNNNLALPMKEAALNILEQRILERSGILNYKPEMLRLTKTYDVISKSKEQLMSTHKSRFNVQSSLNVRNRANIQWDVAGQKPGGPSGRDLQLFLLTVSNTVDDKNQVIGNAGGWDHVMSKLKQQGIDKHDPALADRIGNLVIPDDLAIQVGARKGTTFAQHWPARFQQLKKDIKKGYSDQTQAELTYQQATGKEIQAEFIEAATQAHQNGEPLSTQDVNEWKNKFAEVGLPIPDSINKYETTTMRDERQDTQAIKELIASQKGYISNEQLDSFHPLAAVEYRELATKLEKAALKEFGAEKKIKAHLDTAFTNMGIKGNEKSPAYIEAMENAKADYAEKYHQYVAMGYAPRQASHLALNAQQVIDPETKQPLPDSMGVLTEIKTNGEGSKYVMTGQSIEKDLKPGHLRVARIYSGKQEILNDPNIVTTGIIGGDYGHRQITTIKNNIDKYGPQGLYMDDGALAYYQGLARGRNPREGGYWGLVDAQLKALGHKGLNPANRPNALDITTGMDSDGNVIPNPRGTNLTDKQIARAMANPNQASTLYALAMLQDEARFGRGTSIWDQPQYLSHGTI